MDSPPTGAAVLAAALVLASVHVFAGRLRFLSGVPRSRWLSAAAGVSVAYVFVHLLPELAESQEAISADADGALPFLEQHAYLLALVGLAVFYGVERASLDSRASQHDEGEAGTGAAVFALSTASFAVYNALIGYLLVHGEAESGRELAFFTAAIGVHFGVNDFGLREHHKQAYDRLARWVLAGAVLVGWLVGRWTAVAESALALVVAFIAGGVILNVLKEELPGERRARFAPFTLAAAGYALLLEAA